MTVLVGATVRASMVVLMQLVRVWRLSTRAPSAARTASN
jgi:hypothetical protein